MTKQYLAAEKSLDTPVLFIYLNIVGEGDCADLKPWKKFILLRISVFNYISNQLHKQAKCVLEQDGELQRIYKETIKNDNR